jgi:6-phosphogluconolactonase
MIRVYPDHELLSQAAAELVVAEARSAIEERHAFLVCLSGGNTPRRTYQILTEPKHRGQLDWQKVHVFWGDERCVPPDDPQSNERMAWRALLDHVPIPSGQVHPIRCADSPEIAAEDYETLLHSRFGPKGTAFDLVLLGLGENGHTASLFPDAAVLDEQKSWVAAVYVREQDLYRVTLTAPAINMAKKIVFLVSGEDKAGVLKEVLEGPSAPRHLPAQLIKPADGELIWLVDDKAGRLLRDAQG